MKTKQLILITSSFPFGKGETFLETEIEYLCREFENVKIVSRGDKDQGTREIPKNAAVISIGSNLSDWQRIASLFNIFNRACLSELKNIHSLYRRKITIGIFKTVLISFQQAKRVRNIVQNELNHIELGETVIYSYWCDDASISLALLKKKNRKLKVISRVHGWDVYFNVSQFNYLPFRSLICQNMDAIYSISKKGQAEISETWKQNLSNVFVSHLGVTSQVLKEAPNKFKIVSCSNLISLKRVHLIIDALALLTSFSIEWIHFGDGQLFNQLKGQANNLPDNIIVDWRGQVRNEDVLNYYTENDVSCFINVSSSEGIPVSIMEAMSFGIPVIGTNVGGVSEIVNEDNGYLLSANPTSQEIVSVIEKFQQLSNEDKEKKRKAAYSTWENKFNAEKNYTQFVEDILSL
ncbi:glycosyltransferase [Crocinitomicaceae bacterium]|nr:glycosyltransferase [Crocinitomicaceae bacterium]